MKEMNENIDSPMLSSEDKPINGENQSSYQNEWIAILEHNKLSSFTFVNLSFNLSEPFSRLCFIHCVLLCRQYYNRI